MDEIIALLWEALKERKWVRYLLQYFGLRVTESQETFAVIFFLRENQEKWEPKIGWIHIVRKREQKKCFSVKRQTLSFKRMARQNWQG